MNEHEQKLQDQIDEQYKNGIFNIGVIEALKNQEHINELTSERFDVIIEAFENQGRINESNRKTIAKHAESIRWLYFSNVALIIALVALLLK